MYEYYNTNPLGKNVGDCVIRALSKALNMSWQDVYIDLCVQGLYMADLPSSNAVWGAYLQDKGFKRYIIPNICPICYSVNDFCNEHPTGVYVLGTGTHVVTVIDGVFYDSWNSGNEIALFYFS